MTRYFNLQSQGMRRVALLTVIGLAASIAWLSLTPSSSIPRFTWSDKFEHFLAYAALGGPLVVALGRTRWLVAIILAVGYGTFMEIAQGTMGLGRTADLLDGIANTLGACAGVGLGALLLRAR